jgi:hypothetical protein
MFLSLPKDVIWLIFKSYLKDVANGLFAMKRDIHCTSFTSHRSKSLVDKTYHKNVLNNPYNFFHLIDFVYPLCLVCKQFQGILKNKIVNKVNNGIHCIQLSI